jgi:poly(A) polymerase
LLAPLVHLEVEAGTCADWITRLASLGAEDPAKTLRLSRAETKSLAAITALLADPVPVATAAHCNGARAARAVTLLRAAGGDVGRLANMEAEIARGVAAKFPLRAADLIRTGMQPGPALGAALEAARSRWLDSDFSLDREKLLGEALGQGR